MLSGQNSAGKVITRAHVHCVFQTSAYPVNIPSLSSQSECAKNTIHRFGKLSGSLLKPGSNVNVVLLCYFTSLYVTLRYTVLCYLHHATLRYIVLCVTLRYVMLCCVILHHVTLRYIVLCYFTSRYATLYCVVLFCITLRYVTLHYIVLCFLRHVTLRYIVLCCLHHVTLRYIVLCCVFYITLRYVTLYCVVLCK